MAKKNAAKFPMPGSSWETVKRIVRAYYAARNDENPTVEGIAKLAGLGRPIVSMNNNFLKYIGVVQTDTYRLTPPGMELAAALALGSTGMAGDALRKLVQGCETLRKLRDMVHARGEMKLEVLRGQIMLETGLDPDSRQIAFVKTIVDLLAESGLIEAKDDSVRAIQPMGISVADNMAIADEDSSRPPADPVERVPIPGFSRIPIPVSAASVWYVEVPDGPKGEEVRKFLEMQKLIFDIER